MSSDPQRVTPRMVQELLENSRRRAEQARLRAAEIRDAEDAVKSAAMERRGAGRVDHLRGCGVPDGPLLEAFRQHAGVQHTAALTGVLSWLGGKKPFCLLSGSTGSGKSVAAVFSLLRAVRVVRVMAHPLSEGPVEFEELNHRNGLFITAASARFASRFADGPETGPWVKACTVPWLVLDELRLADLDEKGVERFQELLGCRYAASLRTVMTTNHEPKELSERLGEAMASRLAEGCVVVDPGDTDLRRARA